MTVPDPYIEIPGIGEALPEWNKDRIAEVLYAYPEMLSEIERGWDEIHEAIYLAAIARSNRNAAQRRGEKDMLKPAADYRLAESFLQTAIGKQSVRVERLVNTVARRPSP